MNLEGIEKLMEIVPQQYSDAVAIHPWLERYCKPHEWDNRTTIENSEYVISYYLKKNNVQKNIRENDYRFFELDDGPEEDDY